MNRETKLRVHLEYVIFEDLPEGTALTATKLNILCDLASTEQKRRAFERALTRSPILLDGERESEAFDNYAGCWRGERRIM